MRLMVFTVVGMMLFLIAYGLGISGTDAAMIFLFVLFLGAADRVAQPLRERLRA